MQAFAIKDIKLILPMYQVQYPLKREGGKETST